MTDLGERLRTLRYDKGLSLADIKKRTGILKCYLPQVEMGFAMPRLPMVPKWAKPLRAPLFDISLPEGITSQPGLLASHKGKNSVCADFGGRFLKEAGDCF
jgi:transcriptional regulator with XRE-family HTH domain